MAAGVVCVLALIIYFVFKFALRTHLGELLSAGYVVVILQSLNRLIDNLVSIS